MGRKWTKIGLTADGILYFSEAPDPEDVRRLKEKARDPEEEKKLEQRADELLFALGAKWG